MKVSEITVNNIAEYLRLETGEYNELELANLLNVAKKFISEYTGIPITTEDTTIKTLDDYEDFYIVVMILCQDMHDNRALYDSKVNEENLNMVVKTILGMHSKNLL
ncbi:head-tail connector protein [Brassicibacter mesophilus]|uniref:head-tail connector protein n=1 Tax=Brassicibacter mesophilus TaxID=745119 RepID=UPI003D1E8A56